MNYPTYVVIDDTRYDINTDFRVAIKCNKISEDTSIGDLERAMGIICTLFGEKALDNANHYEDLLIYAKKFLSCNKEIDNSKNEKQDMDYEEDYGLIWASMYSEYHGLDIDKEQIHWWRFNDLMNGLSNSEMGNCCVLNRIRNLRNYDTKEIKDPKERRRVEDAKKSVALKKYQPKKVQATEQQLKSAEEFYKALNI